MFCNIYYLSTCCNFRPCYNDIIKLIINYLDNMTSSRRLINKRYYTVGEAAYIIGVTPLTLRNWDKAGKLQARRNPINNYRVYAARDIERLLRRMNGPSNNLDII